MSTRRFDDPIPLRRKLDISAAVTSSLLPKQNVNDQVINAYLRLIERRNWAFSALLPRVWSYDTLLWEMLEQSRSSAFGPSKIINPFDMDLLLFPRNIHHGGCYHWVLIAAWPQLKRIVTFDSLGYSYFRLQEEVLHFLAQEAERRNQPFEETLWTLIATPANCPRQEERECGVMVCLMAEYLARREDVSQIETAALKNRKTIMTHLRRERIAQEVFQPHEFSTSSFLEPNEREKANGDQKYLPGPLDSTVDLQLLPKNSSTPRGETNEDASSTQSETLSIHANEEEFDLLSTGDSNDVLTPTTDAQTEEQNISASRSVQLASHPMYPNEPTRRKKNRKSKRRRVFMEDGHGNFSLQRINVKYLPGWL